MFAAIGMVITFYIVNGMGPGIKLPILDNRITDDKFCIAFDKSEVDASVAESFFTETGADEVNSKII